MKKLIIVENYLWYLDKDVNNRVGESEIGETGIGECGIGETGTFLNHSFLERT